MVTPPQARDFDDDGQTPALLNETNVHYPNVRFKWDSFIEE